MADETTLLRALANTHGLRLMGQRTIPDSYLMTNLVYPTVGPPFPDAGQPFTWVLSPAGPVRGFPRGLDVLSVLGSQRARALVRELRDDRYRDYDDVRDRLFREFAAISQKDHTRNLYWSWLYCLKALLDEVPEGHPTFMRSVAWNDKSLNTALGSWSQLRHDTILYAKQSYTAVALGISAGPPMVEGYVEPAAAFYARLLSLSRMTREGLTSLHALQQDAISRLSALEQVLERLLEISKKELQNQRLTENDYRFIREYAAQLERAVAGVNSEGLNTTLIADVHTDQNTGQVLEEGTGYLRLLLVCYPMPDGGTVLGAGPVFSYYEFKHPMSDRLTDESWRTMLRNGNAPEPPQWVRSFTAF
jgi:hypothetical protein